LDALDFSQRCDRRHSVKSTVMTRTCVAEDLPLWVQLMALRGSGMTPTPPKQSEFAPDFRSCQIDPKDDPALLERAFKLRYEVYCRECEFLPAANFPDELERDDYDANAAHFCTFNRKDELVGYVRLAHADPYTKTFPFQGQCTHLFDGIDLPDALQSSEISRLMVREDYRRRHGDTLPGVSARPGHALPEHEMRKNSPQILLSLYRQMYAFSLTHGLRFWYAAMERSLARALIRMHFNFHQIGPLTDYYGPVAPYMADLRDLETQLQRTNPELLAWMRCTERP
jgi:N-acyl amino acid synthase of PEP-CTERM/exosortase system